MKKGMGFQIETRAHDQYWVVHREEVQLTDRDLEEVDGP